MNGGPNPDPFYGKYAWANRYLLDWFPCGEVVTQIRLYTTVLRWFDRPRIRWRQLRHGMELVTRDSVINNPQHLTNLADLMDSHVQPSTALPCGPFAAFLADLYDGDLIDGGPVSHPDALELAPILPGYAYALDRWKRYFADHSMPWPFFFFPLPRPFVLP